MVEMGLGRGVSHKGGEIMKKRMRFAIVGLSVGVLLIIFIASSYFNSGSSTQVNISPIIAELSAGASFQYSFISADRLKQSTISWQHPISFPICEMWSIGDAYLLALSRAEFPGESPYSRRFEETVSFFDTSGILLNQRSIGEYQVKKVVQSGDDDLITIVAEKDHDVLNFITDQEGREYLRIGHSTAFLPSWDGSYLVAASARKAGLKGILTITAGGQERTIAAARLLNKDGSTREQAFPGLLQEESQGVLGIFSNDKMLFTGCDTTGLVCILTMYDLAAGRVAWTKQVPPLTSLEAVCQNAENAQSFMLMNAGDNERGVQSFVLAEEDGRLVCELIGSPIWSSIGSQMGRFLSIIPEAAPAGQRPGNVFVLAHTPEFTLESYGVLCENHSWRSMKLCGDYLYGIVENCPIDGKVIPVATMVFNISAQAQAATSNDLIDRKIQPVVLEGGWHILRTTADNIQIIGSFDTGQEQLMRISVPKTWLE